MEQTEGQGWRRPKNFSCSGLIGWFQRRETSREQDMGQHSDNKMSATSNIANEEKRTRTLIHSLGIP